MAYQPAHQLIHLATGETVKSVYYTSSLSLTKSSCIQDLFLFPVFNSFKPESKLGDSKGKGEILPTISLQNDHLRQAACRGTSYSFVSPRAIHGRSLNYNRLPPLPKKSYP